MASNQLLTPSIISKESLMILENNLVAANRVNRKFENQFVKIGSQLTIRKPNKYTVKSGPALQVQDTVEPSTTITVNQQKHVDIQFSSQDLALNIEEFSERYLKPAMATLANQIDYDVISNYTAIANSVGTPGSTPSSFATSVQLVGQKLDEMAAPQDGRTLMLNPAAYWNIANGLSNNYVTQVSKDALIKGYLATIGNFEVFMDQNIQSQTTGTYGGTPVVNGANQTGSSLVTNGWTITTTTLNVGDTFTIAGVHAVNPQSRVSTGALQNFVVTTKTTTDGAGNSTISIYPAITTSGAYQTVDASPANGATITVLGSSTVAYPQNLAFHKDAFGLVMVPLEVPQGVHFAARSEYKGISLRIVSAYDINNDVFPCRIDVLYGTATYYPELACRLYG